MSKKTYLVSELDERTRGYLHDVGRAAGQGMAGIFLSAGSQSAAWGFPLAGIVILGVVLYFALPPLNDPTHQAMLLTAGLLMGGWLVLAGIRMVVASIQGNNLGTFIYADPRQIWSVDYSVVQRWSLKDLQRFTMNGTELLLEYPDGVEKVPVPFEIGILEIAVYLDYWLQVRGEGTHDQALIDAHATAARAAAFGEELDAQPDFRTDIPVPKPDESVAGKSRDWPILLGIVFFAIGLFFVVHWVILVWHDYAVFNFVRNQSPAHWRAYLLDDRNTRNREQVKQMLRDHYRQKADQLKAQILANPEPGFQGSEVAMTQILSALAEAPQPIVTLRIQDTTEPGNQPPIPPIAMPGPFDVPGQFEVPGQRNTRMIPASERQNWAQIDITDALYLGIGDKLISIAQPPEDVSALIDIRFKFVREKDQHRLEWTLAVRKDVESEPHYQKSWVTNVAIQTHPNDVFSTDIRRLRHALAGIVGNGP